MKLGRAKPNVLSVGSVGFGAFSFVVAGALFAFARRIQALVGVRGVEDRRHDDMIMRCSLSLSTCRTDLTVLATGWGSACNEITGMDER